MGFPRQSLRLPTSVWAYAEQVLSTSHFVGPSELRWLLLAKQPFFLYRTVRPSSRQSCLVTTWRQSMANWSHLKQQTCPEKPWNFADMRNACHLPQTEQRYTKGRHLWAAQHHQPQTWTGWFPALVFLGLCHRLHFQRPDIDNCTRLQPVLVIKIKPKCSAFWLGCFWQITVSLVDWYFVSAQDSSPFYRSPE